ncbi:hypothetical protein COLO4_16393 [Corchorus olitorius]|uniref:Uncharacterized protein n=1 Tax=Corchorus olitorius TaxID=93759 RepID=A0A1R3JHL0_9ROSI|nr:hypothetical protein COLO4_16393 [Corchorus olitorius]
MVVANCGGGRRWLVSGLVKRNNPNRPEYPLVDRGATCYVCSVLIAQNVLNCLPFFGNNN